MVFVSNTEALIKAAPYRHIAILRKLKQGILPGLGTNDGNLANEETVELYGTTYHVRAIISNIWDEEWSLQSIVEWYSDRCGGGEAIHSILRFGRWELAIEQVRRKRGVVERSRSGSQFACSA